MLCRVGINSYPAKKDHLINLLVSGGQRTCAIEATGKIRKLDSVLNKYYDDIHQCPQPHGYGASGDGWQCIVVSGIVPMLFPPHRTAGAFTPFHTMCVDAVSPTFTKTRTTSSTTTNC